MTAAAETAPGAAPVPPAADPQAIRACLTPQLTAEFDREWASALDEAKQAMQLAPIHDLLRKWQFIAYGELKDPGSHYRMLAKIERIQRLGRNPDAVPLEDVQALIRKRLGR